MLKFEVYSEEVNAKRDKVEAVTVPMWVDIADVFAVRADFDPEWAVLTFKPGVGVRTLIVRGAAETVAEKRRERLG